MAAVALAACAACGFAYDCATYTAAIQHPLMHACWVVIHGMDLAVMIASHAALLALYN